MKRITLLLLVLVAHMVEAQTPLDRYIIIALNNNEAIKQQQFLLTKNLYLLKEARSLFLPSIGLNASYTIADGGRTVDFPVGDLLNPVYKSLNQLSGSNSFPSIPNQSILLNPNNFYDAKIRTTYPLLNAELEYNRKIKARQYRLQEYELNLYKRELVKEVKTAYYKYLQSREAVNIYQTALSLASENVRVNTSLFNNQKINRTAVIRSENELTRYNALLESARQTQNNAQAYFNFLLNTELSTPIVADSVNSITPDPFPAPETVANREELSMLKESLEINKDVTSLARSYSRPKINSFVDLGSQAFHFQVNQKSLYYLAGIGLEWNIFSGNKNKYRIRQAEADGDILKSQQHHTEQQFQLQLAISSNQYKAAIAQYNAALFQVTTAQKYYQDILRLYKEGQVLFIELLDAQNEFITAKLQLNISLFDAWIKSAEIERANAGYNLQQLK